MSRPEGGLYGPLLISIGIAVVGLGGLLLILALGTLIGPFHFWAPQTREGEPIEVRGATADLMLATPDVTVRVEPTGPSRLLLRASNDGEEPFDGLEVQVRWRGSARGVSAQRTTLGQAQAQIRFEPGEDSAALILPRLRPGQTLTYAIDLE